MSIADIPLRDWKPRQIIGGTLVVCAVYGAFMLAYASRQVLLFLFIAIVVSTALRPIVMWAERRRIPRAVSAPTLYLGLLVLLLAPMMVGLPLIGHQVREVLKELPESYAEFRQQVVKILPQLEQRLPEEPPWAGREEEVGEKTLQTISQALTYTGTVVGAGLSIAAVLLMSFFWTLYEERTIRSLLLFLPATRRQEAGELVEAMQAKVGGYVRGQGLLCLSVGVVSFAAYKLIGLPHATALAVIAGVLEAVPMFGPALGAVAPMLVALSVDPSKVIWVLVAAIVIQQAENYLLVPRIMGKTVGVNPVVTLLAIAAFGTLMGVAGAVLAIPMAAIIQLLLERYLLKADAIDRERAASRDALGRLRLQSQELMRDIRQQVREKDTPMSSRADRIEDAMESIADQIDYMLETQSEAQLDSGSWRAT